ncbi:EAL domain-containing protein [Vibrio mediterranei]|uniref:EAL domain-containing protein n=1 Tax=Vibrio mediterranei TaxID=689 RepID=A0A3G4VBS6_9VIBR|nr:EAL domain-containing protein [Vibrio mediterranei]
MFKRYFLFIVSLLVLHATSDSYDSFILFLFSCVSLVLLLFYIYLLYLIMTCKYHLQPVVDYQDNKVVYFEVLSRFSAKNPPLQVIDLFRRNGVLYLHTLLQIKRLQMMNTSLDIGINLCPSLLSGCLSSLLLNYLSGKNSIKYIEITEDSSIEYSSKIIENILGLKNRGKIIVIDDFGIGNNNIFLVDKVLPEIVKVDKSISQILDSSNERQGITSTISNLCSLFDCTLVIEGIESLEQLEKYEDMDNVYFQGFYFNSRF